MGIGWALTLPLRGTPVQPLSLLGRINDKREEGLHPERATGSDVLLKAAHPDRASPPLPQQGVG